jgi:hypothetical protein
MVAPPAAANGIPVKTNPTGIQAPGLSPDDTAVGRHTQVDWKSSPPPVRVTPEQSQAPSSPATDEKVEDTVPVAPCAAASSTAQVSSPADVLYESAHASIEARRGLGTLRAVIERTELTRQLLWNWQQAGRYLNKARCRLTRPAEQNELSRCLQEITDLMEDFPRLLGQPGQPGYRVVAMARLEMTLDMFGTLDAQQREAISRDWIAGRVVLLAHRRFLHEQLRKLRKSNFLGRWLRACRAAINDHPVLVVLTVAVGALASVLFYAMID